MLQELTDKLLRYFYGCVQSDEIDDVGSNIIDNSDISITDIEQRLLPMSVTDPEFDEIPLKD